MYMELCCACTQLRQLGIKVVAYLNERYVALFYSAIKVINIYNFTRKGFFTTLKGTAV